LAEFSLSGFWSVGNGENKTPSGLSAAEVGVAAKAEGIDRAAAVNRPRNEALVRKVARD
jgi:hypothetical protein